MSFNGDNMTPLGGNARAGENSLDRNAPMGWAYQSKTDDLEAVLATGYFDTFHLFLVAGQFIYVSLADEKAFLTVQSVDKALKQVVMDPATVGGGGDAHIPNGVVEVFSEEDFGVLSGGVIPLTPGITYTLMNDINTNARFDIAGSSLDSIIVIRSNHPSTNALVSTGSGDPFFFNNNPSGDGGLLLKNMAVVDGAGLSAGRGFIDFVVTNFGNSVFQLEDVTVDGFFNDTDAASVLATQSFFEKVVVLIARDSRWRNSNTINLIDTVFRGFGLAMINIPETTNTALRVSSKDSLVGSQIAFDQSAPPFNSMEIHSNLNALSSVVISDMFLNPFSTGMPGEDIFFNDETGAVTSVSNAGAGNATATAAGHNLLDGDTVIHDTDFSNSSYQGSFEVVNVVAGVSYNFNPSGFVGNDSGTWTNESLTQKDPKVIARGNERINLPNSMTVSSIRSTKTLVVNGTGVQNTFVPIVDSISPQSGDFVIDTEERITTDDQTGLATYNGLVGLDVQVQYSFNFVHSSGSAQDLEFAITQNGVAVLSSVLPLDSGMENTISTIGTILELEPGDTIGLVKNNTTNEVNTDISNIRRLITVAG